MNTRETVEEVLLRSTDTHAHTEGRHTREPGLHALLIEARAAAEVYRRANRAASTALAPVKLSAAKYLVLEMLWRTADAPSIAQVAAFLDVHRTSAASTIKALERAGLVLRQAGAPDRRRVAIRLTPDGIRRLRQARALVDDS